MSIDERAHDRRRLRQWLAGRARAEGVRRRDLLRLLAAAGAVSAGAAAAPRAAAAPAPADGPADPAPGIVKPLPEEQFTVRGTNAETRWSALRGTGYHTPNALFFVRNHTATPLLDADAWRLRVWGSGLRGGEAVFGLDDLRRLPATTHSAFVECAGNGRSFYASQQGETVSGTAWTLGAIGVARWRGVRLAEVLARAGLRGDAVDVMPRGLDAEVTDAAGANLGHVRRPLPLAKALSDVLLAYEMNGEPLPPDHGAPVRVLVPSWVGISHLKWVGDIEVAAEPLYSPWNTDLYRLFGPVYPPEGSEPLTRQSLKSAFELPFGAAFVAGRSYRLHGRSWSGAGGVRRVEVSTDGGASWRPARLRDAPRRDGWVRWSAEWTPAAAGPAELLARATDERGTTQPERAVFNEQGYLFDAVVRHPVEVSPAA
ncbi:sulfite oxidase [Streptomyces hoynatensis]|uniref:Sulfite oxidase n=1 Tax=Streptomyces hoynatensis TaxID=1141874 RepID=A0A3A9YQM2_9ACTN|nr:sulfite oxidase [Streptomyces hoynatensis]RKN38283.1 sulfite oxidase [Streptomyces hoynatensis]